MSVPFKRANEWVKLMLAAMALTDVSAQKAAVDAIDPYRSRGKGGPRSKPGRTYRDTNKFLPDATRNN